MAKPTKAGIAARIWEAVRQLNPSEPLKESRRAFVVALVAEDLETVEDMKTVLLGPNPSEEVQALTTKAIKSYILPLEDSARTDIQKADIVLVTPDAYSGLGYHDEKYLIYDSQRSSSISKTIAESDTFIPLRLSLAHRLPGIRRDVARVIVRDISRENAVFAIGTSLGDVIPSPLLPLIGLAEAASDTVFLTSNQVRMLFVLGAAYGSKVGYVPQWKEVSSIIGAAFGWRAIARELVSKIPFGGGIVSKAAVAYAGTAVVGEGIVFYYTTGRHMTRAETSAAFKQTYSRALDTVRSLVDKFLPRSDKSLPSDASGSSDGGAL